MSDLRCEVQATLTPSEYERLVDGSRLQLVRVLLTDDGIVAAPDGTDRRRPDVSCPLRPSEARQLAHQLLALATQAEEITQP